MSTQPIGQPGIHFPTSGSVTRLLRNARVDRELEQARLDANLSESAS